MNAENTGGGKSPFCNHHSKDQFGRASIDAKYGGNTDEEQNMRMVLKLPFMGCLFITREKNSNYALEISDNTLTVWWNYVYHQWVGRDHVPSGVIPQEDSGSFTSYSDQEYSQDILMRKCQTKTKWGVFY